MYREPTYQAARSVAATLSDHFARHVAAARERGDSDLARAPDAAAIAAIIDATFWASLRREEGQSPKISLAFVPPEQAGYPLIFEQPLPLAVSILTKLGPAVERPGIHLGVWQVDGDLKVWGATRKLPNNCFVLEVVEPGLLVVKHRRRDGFGKFANVAVLKGEQVKVMDEQGGSLPDCPALLTTLLSFTSMSAWDDSAKVLVQLAGSMRGHGHGGSLLVVPKGTETWRESVVHPILYSVAPFFSGLADLMRMDVSERSQGNWDVSVRKAVETVAGLTAVDGATVITDRYEVLAFGVKIRRGQGNAPIEQLTVTEPIIGDEAMVIHPSQTGGTRHLSAAQFIYDQHDGMALVASQDGHFTIFAWSPCDDMVHAHRVETLLL